MNTRSDYEGVELDWFAVDDGGFVALLSSAGFGPIPDVVFERFDGQRRIEEFLGGIIGTPASADLCRVQQLLSLAGVFAFDWKHWDGPYQRTAVPTQPRRLEDFCFSQDLREAFVVIPGSFSTSVELRPELYLPCAS